MVRLLNIEFLKLQRNRSFLILMALFAISTFGVNYIASEIITNSPLSHSFVKFSDVWEIVPYVSSYLLIILAFITIMQTCSEYTYHTHRQNVIDGLSRSQYITAKILFIVVLALFATVITFISAFVMGISSYSSVSFEGFRFIFYFFVQTIAYLSFAFLFALTIKKSAPAIGIFFIYSLIIENILEKYINKIITGIDKTGGFLPISSSEHLLLPDKVKNLLKIVNISDPHPEYAYLIASIVYIALCYFTCFYRYKKMDL